MKKVTALFSLSMLILTGCDKDTGLPPYTATIFLEDFEDVENGIILNLSGWTNYSAEGNTSWHGEVYNGNNYAALENSGDASVVTWLVSPAINLSADKRTLSFLSAQHHLMPESSLEVYLSTNFNGDPETADWIPLEATIADSNDQWYSFISSKEIDLANYSGTVHIAFKAMIQNEGAYFLDNVKIY